MKEMTNSCCCTPGPADEWFTFFLLFLAFSHNEDPEDQKLKEDVAELKGKMSIIEKLI